MTRACVFVGPTLSRGEVASALDAIVLPPVAQGDVVRAVRRYRPHAIGIIDGLFGGAPSVWHKEILWAMAQGIAMFGGASMGALRGAELHAYGMRGVGRIFEAYRQGTYEDDDEVAVLHAPAEMDYAALSEPMVNIRATLARAEAEGILSSPSRQAVEDFAKSLFFPDRCWPALQTHLHASSDGGHEANGFKDWLSTGRVDLKREDALAMLATMGEHGEGAASLPVLPVPEMTHFLADLLARPDRAEGAWPGDTVERAVLDELRLGARELFQSTTTKALLRLACTGMAPVGSDSPEAVADAIDVLRSKLALFSRSEMEAWLARNDLDAAALGRLAAGSTRVERFSAAARPSLSAFLLDELKLSGDYVRLAERARVKRERLLNEPEASAEPTPPERLALRLWFSERCLDRPEGADLDTLLSVSGFADASHLDRSLLLERLYLRLTGSAANG